MALADLRLTNLQIINEVRNKLGVHKDVATVTEDNHSTTLLNYLNDVVDITSDYGDWHSVYNETLVTASSSIRRYAINTATSAGGAIDQRVVKSIYEIAFENQIAPMRLRTIDDLRRWQRVSGVGVPRNWQILTETTAGNPQFDVYPQPGNAENNRTFNVAWYEKPPIYTSADGAIVPPFSSRLLVDGLLSMALLDESRGTQNIDFMTQFKVVYEPKLKEAYNRFHGDSGTDTYFRPRISGFRRV